jgi:hypothetical protein
MGNPSRRHGDSRGFRNTSPADSLLQFWGKGRSHKAGAATARICHSRRDQSKPYVRVPP